MDVNEIETQVAPGIHHFSTGPFNWYLIEQGSRITLVDAGFPGHYQTYRKGMEHLGYADKDVEAIVLTHAHADHIGFAEKVRQLSNAPVYVHKADAIMAQKSLQLPWFGLLSNAWRTYVMKVLGVAVVNGVFTFPYVKEVKRIEDGDRLEIPGRPRVIHTPGHTAGEIVLYLEDRNTLISGDTIVTQNLLTGESGQPQLTNPILNDNFQQAGRSLELLKELGNLTILPGHGPTWTGSVAEAVELAKQSL